ncbi:MAG: hypothetical protein AAGC55_09580 [Myxococcota bacterium]
MDSAAGDAGSTGDNGPIGDTDANPLCGPLPFQPLNITGCEVTSPGPAIEIADVQIIDTDTLPPVLNGTELHAARFVQPDGDELLIVAVTDLDITAQGVLEVTGSRPLVIVASGEIAIQGVLYAGAQDAQSGPGGDSQACQSRGAGSPGQTQTADGDMTAGTGGGGGGFGSSGGSGAQVPDGGEVMPGGLDSGDDRLSPLRGGCSGGAGGQYNGAGDGAGGGAGGAVHLIAGDRLIVDDGGVVTAPGGGGQGASGTQGGGGGGGSGGAIVLEASELDIRGAITANGGGGGEGRRGGSSSNAGDDGSDDSADSAPGGADGANSGGDGGAGSAGDEMARDGQPGINDTRLLSRRGGGGGGGGGGVGRIRIIAHDGELSRAAATISPAPRDN